MPYTYLLTGATSDVGVELLDRILSRDPTATAAAQGCGDLAYLNGVSEKYPGRIKAWDADLTEPTALQRFLDEVEQFGAPSHFVHLPALRMVNTAFKNFDEARFLLDMRVQVQSAAAVCRRFVPVMAKAKFGRVLFMLTSYILGVPPRNAAAYVMAKQALHGLAQSLAADYAGTGVTVNCVAPSMMATKFLADTPQLVIQMACEKNPMGRIATPADVAPAMAFLLSDEAAFITGAVLPVTGGES